MFDALVVRNFKSIRHLELPSLGTITLLSGRNNSGKTNLLEAIFALFDYRNPVCLLRGFELRGIPLPGLTAADWLVQVVHRFDHTDPIQIQLTGTPNNVSAAFSVTVDELDPIRVAISGKAATTQAAQLRGQPLVTVRVQIDQNGSVLSTSDGLVQFQPDNVSMQWKTQPALLPNAMFLGLRNRPSFAEDSLAFSQLDIEGQSEGVKAALRDLFPEVKDISTGPVGGQLGLYVDVGLTRKIPLAALGEGAATIASQLLAVSRAKGGVLLLDELGSGLHVSVMTGMWRALRRAASEYSCQIVAATHNADCIRGFADAATSETSMWPDETSCRFYRLERDEASGMTNAVDYELSELTASLDHGWEVR